MIRLAGGVALALVVSALLVARSGHTSTEPQMWDFAALTAGQAGATTPAPTVAPDAAGPPRTIRATAIAQNSCTARVANAAALTAALSSGSPRICVTANLPTRLTITKRGSHPPMMVIGTGQTSVKGITVKDDNVFVTGFQVLGAAAPGIEITGNNIAIYNNIIKHPTGGDFDGIRFFGNHLSIVHNTITDISPDGSGAHADCMQTFTSGGGPPADNVAILSNRCDNIDNQCIMAEGPEDKGDGGGGPGKSDNWLVRDNYCKFNASQALMIEAIHHVQIRNNEFVGKADKAIGLDVMATGATVAGNKLVGIKTEVGMSENSKPGYQGPQPQGGP